MNITVCLPSSAQSICFGSLVFFGLVRGGSRGLPEGPRSPQDPDGSPRRLQAPGSGVQGVKGGRAQRGQRELKGCRQQDLRLQAAGCALQGCRLQCRRLQAAGCRLQGALRSAPLEIVVLGYFEASKSAPLRRFGPAGVQDIATLANHKSNTTQIRGRRGRPSPPPPLPAAGGL